MSTEANEPFDWRKDIWKGVHLFRENRDRNIGLLASYAGQMVVWYPDGSGILDVGPDMDTLYARIEASGEDPWPYVCEYVPLPGMEAQM